jgi:hypothetical protein
MLLASFPIRNSFLSTAFMPHKACCTLRIVSCTVPHSQKICNLVSSGTFTTAFICSSGSGSLPNVLVNSRIRHILQKVHFLSTFPKCDITVFPCKIPCYTLNKYSLNPRSRNCSLHTVNPIEINFSSFSRPSCSYRVLTGLICELSKLV